MILFWLLCVSLLLGGLAIRRHTAVWLSGWWLHWFGVRVPVRRTPLRASPRQSRDAPQSACWPPLRVVTRAGP